jgi:hypothetical protein
MNETKHPRDLKLGDVFVWAGVRYMAMGPSVPAKNPYFWRVPCERITVETVAFDDVAEVTVEETRDVLGEIARSGDGR